MSFICTECGEVTHPETGQHVCGPGHWATLKMPRSLWDRMLLRLEAIAKASDMPVDEGVELTSSQRIEALERLLTLIDVDDLVLRDWLETGARR